MIKHILKIMALLTIIAVPTWGQYIEQVEEITAGNFFGIGARQMAMGGTSLMTNDGTSLFYNPANLARIPRIEFNFGLSNQKYSDNSSVRAFRKIVDYNEVVPIPSIFADRFEGFYSAGSNAEDSRSNSRINSALLSIPYPTYRGSLVIGLGVARVADFDRVFSLYHRDTSADGVIVAAANEYQTGGLYQIGIGAGIDISPKISFGATAYLYTGKHEYNWEYRLDSLSVLSFQTQQFIEDKYLGFGAKIGLAIQMNEYIGLGMTVEGPVTLNIEENSSYSDNLDDSAYEDINYVEYDVRKPFVFAAGILTRFDNASIAAEIDYSDWGQLAYGDNLDMEKENVNIKEYYKEALRLRAGGEYIFPSMGLSLRGGIFSDPLPYRDEFQNKSRWGYTFGAGLLVDEVMTIDLAYLHGQYSRNSDYVYSSSYNNVAGQYHYLTIDEDIAYNRLYLTAAYRF
jgi:long-subunit fatty acid transport protein